MKESVQAAVSYFKSQSLSLGVNPRDFDKKNDWTPNINIATNPLKSATYFAPTIPIDVLKKTGNGIPCFWEGLPIKLDKKTRNSAAVSVPKKTTAILSS